MREVILNQDSILEFPKCSHILSISYLKYQSWISVYTLEFQNGHVLTSPANQLAKWSCMTSSANKLANKKVH